MIVYKLVGYKKDYRSVVGGTWREESNTKYHTSKGFLLQKKLKMEEALKILGKDTDHKFLIIELEVEEEFDNYAS